MDFHYFSGYVWYGNSTIQPEPKLFPCLLTWTVQLSIVTKRSLTKHIDHDS